MELNYIFVLTGVAILWRPQANAKEYAFVMQLPVMKEGADDEDGEFEMGAVPSAMDDDDDDDDDDNDEVIFSDEPEKIETF